MSHQNFQNKSIKFAQVSLAAAALMIASIGTAFANDQNKVKIVGAGYGGNGCPEGSASVNVSPDGQELTLLFDKFIAEGNKSQESRKSCNLSIPIQVPQGFQI
ncbi:MAG: DUF4360 domain-containing protein, partial [Dolichospermum sp.]